MRREVKILLAGVALILATNLYALIGVWYNRSGEPDSVIELSERELRLMSGYRSRRENSGISVRLEQLNTSYGLLSENYGSKNPYPWLTRAKLAELGFDMSVPTDAPGAHEHYRRFLAKEVYIVMEYDGPAFQSILTDNEKVLQEKQDAMAVLEQADQSDKNLAQELERAEKTLQSLRSRMSRLVTIDAGLDAGMLRKRYPDRERYLITSAELKPYGLWGKNARPGAWIRPLSVKEIHIPRQFHEQLQSWTKDNPYMGSSMEPRYRIKLGVGRRYEAWVMDVKPYPVDE